jgi:hypothetical protein
MKPKTFSAWHLIIAGQIYIASQVALWVFIFHPGNLSVVVTAQVVITGVLIWLAWQPLRGSVNRSADFSALKLLPKQTFPLVIAGVLVVLASPLGFAKENITEGTAVLSSISAIGIASLFLPVSAVIYKAIVFVLIKLSS